MPKLIDYPLNDIYTCVEVARLIYRYKRISKEQCASEYGSSLSGQFQTLLGSAAKYGLISQKKGVLYSTDLIDEIELAYSDAERKLKLKKAVLSCPFFADFFARETVFVPSDYLEKKLIKEYGVEARKASIVAQVTLKNKVALDDAGESVGGPVSAQYPEKTSDLNVSDRYTELSLPSGGVLFQIQGEELSCRFDCSSREDFELAQRLLEKARDLTT